ncbi:MAG: hypothetical protein HUU28_01440 [Planctomycetaceae bacterium]|nr:hypothetical protein [Planctomycetaceae bacterium]
MTLRMRNIRVLGWLGLGVLLPLILVTVVSIRTFREPRLHAEAARKLDPEGFLETFGLERDPLVLVTDSGSRPFPPRSITFALWPDGHGVFSEPAGTSSWRTFAFNVTPAEAERLASEIFELLRPADGGGWEFTDSPSARSSVRHVDEVVALSTYAVLLDAALIATTRATKPDWPYKDSALQADARSRPAIEAQIELGELLTKFTSTVRASATPITLTPRSGHWSDFLR